MKPLKKEAEALRKALLPALLLTAALLLTGCSGTPSLLEISDLYTLPKLPAQYAALNERIGALLEQGLEYAAPVAGTNIQPIQLRDLDGDGSSEALVFLREREAEKPLKVKVFRSSDEDYTLAATIEGSGTGFYSCAYEDLNADGSSELLIGWRVNPDLLALSVYTMRGGAPAEILNANYVKYTVADLDGDSARELLLLHSTDDGDSVADCYGWSQGGLALKSSIGLSMTMAELREQGRIRMGAFSDGSRALFVSGVGEGGVFVCDVLTLRGGALINAARSDSTGVSREVTTFRGLYPTDIDNDGVTEIPLAEHLPVISEEQDAAYRIDWVSLSRSGEETLKCSTYHNTVDGWYLLWPESWHGSVTAQSGGTADESYVTFSYADDGASVPILRILTLSGANRASRAGRNGRFLLSRQQSVLYAGELFASESRLSLTSEEVTAAFNLIPVEWITSDN